NVRPWGGEPVDIRVSGGVIRTIVPHGPLVSEDAVRRDADHDPLRDDDHDLVRLDGAGRLLFPSFSDVHVHLDSTRVGLPFDPNEVERRNLWSFIQNDRDNWRNAGASVTDRATHTLGRAV